MKIRPLFDRVVIKSCEVEETTKSGLILTGNAKEKPQMAEVIAVGPGGVVDGKDVTMSVNVGDKVIYSSMRAMKSSLTAKNTSSFARAIFLPLLSNTTRR